MALNTQVASLNETADPRDSYTLESQEMQVLVGGGHMAGDHQSWRVLWTAEEAHKESSV